MEDDSSNPGRPSLATLGGSIGMFIATLLVAGMLIFCGVSFYEAWTSDPHNAKGATERVHDMLAYGICAAFILLGQAGMVLAWANKKPHELYIAHLESENEKLHNQLNGTTEP